MTQRGQDALGSVAGFLSDVTVGQFVEPVGFDCGEDPFGYHLWLQDGVEEMLDRRPQPLYALARNAHW